MRRWRPLLFALGLALTLALALHVTDFALTLWQRLSEASPLFLALYGLLIALVAWLLRFGHVASFVSDTVLTGFKAGAAIVIAGTQLPKLLGIDASSKELFPL
ncbi:MAG TPA: SulP family inorganic anion transporter, partial [Plasticicumulans sp.]|nr:SulP family inorganic anion transporter [Plasticicumulans sp.]